MDVHIVSVGAGDFVHVHLFVINFLLACHTHVAYFSICVKYGPYVIISQCFAEFLCSFGHPKLVHACVRACVGVHKLSFLFIKISLY